jgi:branched-chain amino acid transport system ATP-binding protein
VLTVSGLSAWRGRTRVLFDVSFTVEEGETLALVGANGAGKTSTMAAIMGDIRSRGEVRLADQHIDGWSTFRRARAGLSLVPEGRRLFGQMTVHENLIVGVSRADLSRLDSVLDLFPPLRPRLARPISDLSGGEQQMVAIGRALLRAPAVMLLDEPALGLAPGVIADVYRLLEQCKRDGMTMLIAESSIPRAREIANRLCLIKAGVSERIVAADDDAAVAALEASALGGDVVRGLVASNEAT